MAWLHLIHKKMLSIKKLFLSWTVVPGTDQSHEPRIHQNPVNSRWTLLFVLFNFTLSYTLDLVMSNQMPSSVCLSQKTPSWPPVTPGFDLWLGHREWGLVDAEEDADSWRLPLTPFRNRSLSAHMSWLGGTPPSPSPSHGLNNDVFYIHLWLLCIISS